MYNNCSFIIVHSLFIYYLFCCLLTKIFTLLVEEEVMTGEDVKLLQEKITGKLHNYNNYDYCLKII